VLGEQKSPKRTYIAIVQLFIHRNGSSQREQQITK